MKKIIFALFLASISLQAQLPDTDIWLFELGKTKKGIILKKGKNITNRTGYDNQPCFSPDGKLILFTCVKEDKQADIYKYEIKSQKILQLTNTPTSEYSAMYTANEKNISVVLVEKDSSQRIWQFDAVQKKNKLIVESDQKLVTENTDSIGYYAWLNKDTLLYYKLSNPHSLHVLSITTQKDVWLADSPTRAFKPINNWSFFYVVKQKEQNEIRYYNIKLKKSEVVTTTLKENEDFIYDKNLGLVKAEGSKLMRYDEKLKMWLEVVDFSTFGIKHLTRFAISRNGKWLAVVNTKQ